MNKFERGKDIKKTLSIGLAGDMEKYHLLVIDDDDFKPGVIPNNPFEPDAKIEIEDLIHVDDITRKYSRSKVVIMSLKGQFEIANNCFNSDGYSEEWRKGSRYPNKMLNACIAFFIKKLKECEVSES